MNEIQRLLEAIDKIDMQINYVFRTIQGSVGPGSASLFQELENLFEAKKQTQIKLQEESCKKIGNNS